MNQDIIKQNVLKLQNANATPEDIDAYVKNASQEMGAQPPNQNNFLQDIVTDPIKTLIAKPAVRLAQLGGNVIAHAIGIPQENIDYANSQPVNLKVPIFGDMTIEPQKPMEQGGRAQIGSDIFKTASYLLPAEGAAGAGENLFKGQFMKSVGGGALAGSQFGALSGAGTALEKENPTTTSVAVGALGGGITGGTLGAFLGGGGSLTSKGIRNVVDRMTGEDVNKNILDYFTRSVKPTVVGKTSAFGQVEAYNTKALDAVNAIVGNKPNLKYDIGGVPETGRLPQSLGEFSDAIDQTKKTLYDQYNTLAQKAGKGGATVDLNPIANELDTVINSKALSISNPEAVQYAQKLKDRLSTVGKIDTATAEQVVQNFNESLKAYYRNPTYQNASNAAIDAGVANHVRKFLDESIENATGAEYQALKNQYGALKTIEKDVLKRANVTQRANNYGLLDYTNIFSGGDMINGILSLNPAQFLKGAAEFGIKSIIKRNSNPDVQIIKMFKTAEENYKVPPINIQTKQKVNVQGSDMSTNIPLTRNRLMLQSGVPGQLPSNENPIFVTPQGGASSIKQEAVDFASLPWLKKPQ